ncbi:MAG: hypothetical protein KatS3mg002_1423 [Candidatus Woesearchaeota archaeon]|nr:MAG: hypothetical protein KatS3mg002_1423 [Candidatus Woesearchaeota archaeon]
MTNELYYDYITEYMQIFKKTIDEAKIEVLPKLMKQQYLSPQAEIIKYIDEVIKDEDIEKFSENMNYYLTVREEVLKNYTEKRIKQILQKNPDLILKRYIVVGTKKKSTNEVYEKFMNVDSYKKDSLIEHIIKEHPKDLLPENTDETDIETTYTVNVAAFYKKDNNNFRFATLDTPNTILQNNPEYVLISRIKKSKRELEKFIDYLIGTREEFHYDSIATQEIVPKNKAFYDNIEYIHEISDPTPFNIEYRPKGILLPFYNKDNISKLINNGETISNKLLSLKKTPSDDDKNKLLAGIWIDHNFNKMRIETILQIPEFFKWYKGVIGHTSYYQKERSENRIKKQKNNRFYIYKDKINQNKDIIINYNMDFVSKHLEERFKNIFNQS